MDIKSTKSHINMTETEEKKSILLLGKIWNNLAAFNMTDITGNCEVVFKEGSGEQWRMVLCQERYFFLHYG